ncbi:probable E3 ubiquitin-protein ligase RNF144A [Prunus avium]|uniref:RBR-type E3 ubiquitin transferase n=1 Tax=Prunus avium TaxID=42229 RepID=A0A6P5RGP4_PRUAV|nr:probable E3 ubiquitin-protein ligase RNF144A [Prunus avium]XP_021830186.1 probable E3 ubiquitin-protein ligase RNF144A [Prunus avium]
MAQELASANLHLNVDDFYFSALFDQSDHEDENDPVSDSRYAEELQFQEALVSSSIASQTTLNVGSSSSSATAAVAAASSSTSSTTIIQASQATQSTPIHETLNPIQPQIVCGICVEMKEAAQMFRNESCDHSFCSDCIAKHAASKIQDNIHIVVCPGLGCKAVLELDACRPMLPREVLERWNDALCEALVLGAQRLYCPFSDCSIVLIIDNEGEGIRESECPACHRLFCARCQVPWHPGVDCEEFQRLNEDERGRADLMVKELAKQKKWKRCPRCKFYVERTEGCMHISCRCQFQFCYGCGGEWNSLHDGSCARD